MKSRRAPLEGSGAKWGAHSIASIINIAAPEITISSGRFIVSISHAGADHIPMKECNKWLVQKSSLFFPLNGWPKRVRCNLRYFSSSISIETIARLSSCISDRLSVFQFQWQSRMSKRRAWGYRHRRLAFEGWSWEGAHHLFPTQIPNQLTLSLKTNTLVAFYFLLIKKIRNHCLLLLYFFKTCHLYSILLPL